jgi:hypothetical protein
MQAFPTLASRAALCAGLLLAACGGGSSDPAAAPAQSGTPPAAAVAEVRVINASPEPAGLSASIGGAAAGTLELGEDSGYLSLQPGTVTVEAKAGNGNAAAMSANLAAAAGSSTTVIAVGDGSAMKPVIVKDDDGAAIPNDKTQLRVLHAAPKVPPVDVYLTAPGADLAAASPAIGALAFGTLTDPALVPAGKAQVRITLAGTKTVAYDSGELTLPGGTRLLAAAIPLPSGASPISLLLVPGKGKPAIVGDARGTSLRVVHASPDAPAVDVFFGMQQVAKNLSFPGSPRPASVAAGSASFKVNAAGTSTSVIDVNVNLAPRKLYTAMAVNKLASIEPLLIEDDGALPERGKFKVRVIHAAPDVPAVDVYVTKPNDDLAAASPAIAALTFKTVVPASGAPALQLGEGLYRIRITLAGTKTVAYDSGTLPLVFGADLQLAAVQKPSGPNNASPVSLLVMQRGLRSFTLPSR